MYILVPGTDIGKLRKSRFREKMIYFGVIMITLYFGIDYIIEPELPDLDTLADLVLTLLPDDYEIFEKKANPT